MEEDLRAQEAFFRSGEKPSATVIRKNPPQEDVGVSSDGIRLSSILSPVREIREHVVVREKVDMIAASGNNGFPVAERIQTQSRSGGKKSLFRQSLEEKAKRNKEMQVNQKEKLVRGEGIASQLSQEKVKESLSSEGIASQFSQEKRNQFLSNEDIPNQLSQEKRNQFLSNEDIPNQLSQEETEKVKRSLSCEILSEDLEQDVNLLLSKMSKQEIEDAQKELLSSLDPSLISFLQKRSAYKDSLKQKPIITSPIENDQLRGQQIANTIDYSKIQTEEELAAAVSLLPPSEQRKLAWTKPLRETKETAALRFHFDGFIISSYSSYSHHSGLYNHGDEGDMAGYTIGELVMLGRSAMSGQRVIALKCLYSILRIRSLAILYQQELKPAKLPVDVIHLLLFVLQRKGGLEETFLCLQCLEVCCSSQEELYRRLLLSSTYHGYEHAHLQETALLCYEPSEEDEDEEDKTNPFRRENCNNLFSILYECDLHTMLFQLIQQHSCTPSIVNHCFNLLRILVESDKRFSDSIIQSTSLFTQMEKMLSTFISPSTLSSTPYSPQPSKEDIPLRSFYLRNHPQSALASTLYALLFMEAFCRHNKRNALNLYRSKVFSVLKEWLLCFDEGCESAFDNLELNAVMEGVLSVWRILLYYGLDEDGVDPFLPHLIRLSQFSCTCNRVLVWEILEVTILHKKNVTTEYFIDFCNSIILLIVELLKAKDLPLAIETAVIHYYATYVEVVNESMEEWMASGIADTLVQSIQTQIVQLSYSILQLSHHVPSRFPPLLRIVTSSWNQIRNKSSVLYSEEPYQEMTFISEEQQFLSLSNNLYGISRLLLAGIQNSRVFSAMLRESGWLDMALQIVTMKFWEGMETSPHSISFTYLPRLLFLSQANLILVLHTLLPTESKSMDTLNQTSRYRVWRASWDVIQTILPGDEYIALELLIHVLLNPVSIKLYLEHRQEDASIELDLDCLSELLLQQLGEGKLVEHSQSLHGSQFSSRLSLRLLPYSIQPSLPLLPYWYCMPFFKLRFRAAGSTVANPFAVSSARQAIALLDFVRKMEVVIGEEGRVMRLYCLLHLVFAGLEIVGDERVEVEFRRLLKMYGVVDGNERVANWNESMTTSNEGISTSNEAMTTSNPVEKMTTSNPVEKITTSNPTRNTHRDHLNNTHSLLNQLEEFIPKQEILTYLNKLCTIITDEYYFTPFAFYFIFLFLHPARDWNYRVLILNYFLDNNYAYLLLSADNYYHGGSMEGIDETTSQTHLIHYIKQVTDTRSCWETNEEMIEMFLRYFEQATKHSTKMKVSTLFTHFFVNVIVYIRNKHQRYGYFKKQMGRIFPFIQFDLLLSFVYSIKTAG